MMKMDPLSTRILEFEGLTCSQSNNGLLLSSSPGFDGVMNGFDLADEYGEFGWSCPLALLYIKIKKHYVRDAIFFYNLFNSSNIIFTLLLLLYTNTINNPFKTLVP